MIDNPHPKSWQELQNGVCRLLNEVGLTAETEKKIKTPRGEVEIDVYAVDKHSIDKIRYVIECKNWTSTIPQHVVHSFTTVMHETGAHVGYIISKKSLQSGATQYTNHTNISSFTYLELQEKYLQTWWDNHFMPTIYRAADDLSEYTEPINSRRDKFLSYLPSSKQIQFKLLQNKYYDLGMALTFMGVPSHFREVCFKPPTEIDQFKKVFQQHFKMEFLLAAKSYRELLIELISLAKRATEEFNCIFGQNIFTEDAKPYGAGGYIA